MSVVVEVPFDKNSSVFEEVNLSRLESLHHWLATRLNQVATMQEIKRALPDWAAADREMEVFVSKGLIARQGRKYQSLLPTISVATMASLEELSLTIVGELKASLEKPGACPPWCLTLASLRIKDETNSSLLVVPSHNPPVVGACQQSGRYLFVDVASSTAQPSGLASYFAKSQTNSFGQAVLKKIGDVNADYFLAMAAKQLRAMSGGQQPRSERPNLFLDVLKMFGYIVEEEGQWSAEAIVDWDELALNAQVSSLEARIEQALACPQRETSETALLRALILNRLLEMEQGTRRVIRLKKKPVVNG